MQIHFPALLKTYVINKHYRSPCSAERAWEVDPPETSSEPPVEPSPEPPLPPPTDLPLQPPLPEPHAATAAPPISTVCRPLLPLANVLFPPLTALPPAGISVIPTVMSSCGLPRTESKAKMRLGFLTTQSDGPFLRWMKFMAPFLRFTSTNSNSNSIFSSIIFFPVIFRWKSHCRRLNLRSAGFLDRRTMKRVGWGSIRVWWTGFRRSVRRWIGLNRVWKCNWMGVEWKGFMMLFIYCRLTLQFRWLLPFAPLSLKISSKWPFGKEMVKLWIWYGGHTFNFLGFYYLVLIDFLYLIN